MSGNGQKVTDEDLAAAQGAAERFLTAVDKSDHRGVWEQFSDNARAYVLNRAVDKGMDFDLMSSIRDGSASEEDLDTYYQQLLEGLRRDLRGVEIGSLKYEAKPEPETTRQIRVVYLVEMAMQIGDQKPSIPAGSVLMAPQGGEWKVERLIPRPG